MSDVLTLASDFIDRMSNPGYGIRVNEDYSLRFANLLSSEGFDRLIQAEAGRLSDVNALSPHGWLWLLGWARAKDVSLNDKLLLDLAERWSNVFMQVSVIELATQRSDWDQRAEVTSLENFDHAWLRELMRRCTKWSNMEQVKPEDYTGRSERCLIALLQVGRDITLDAASSLLNHHWLGQATLLKFFWLRCDLLDEETRSIWISRLQPPRRPDERL